MTAATTSTTTTGSVDTGSKPASKPAPKPSLNSQTAQQKNVARRSKPIINWFQRKLAGTGKAKRAVESVPPKVPRKPLRSGNRVASSPLPSPVPAHVNRQQGRLDALAVARRKTISLNGDDDTRESTHSEDEDRSSSNSDYESMARGSAWSPRSVIDADEDASVRPLPPSSPPSPSPSRSSSSYLSDPRTFKSIAASTKPTTLLSIDLHGNGMAHIAEAPITPSSQVTRFPHVRTSSTSTSPNLLSSGASITFSALPPSPQSSSRPSSTVATPQNVQAPLHTTHHPRNNPRPSSPPMDNASMLTLASSAYAMPGLRVGTGTSIGWGSSPPSAVVGGESASQFDGTYADAESQNDEEQLDDRDADASLRALRPRSTRRGSWESEASRWSARIQVGTGTPSLRDRSLWTANSIRTGALSTDHVDVYEKSDETGNKESPEIEDDVDGPQAADDESVSPTAPSEAADAGSSESASKGANLPGETEIVPAHPPAAKHLTSADTVIQDTKDESNSSGEATEAIKEEPEAAKEADDLRSETDDTKQEVEDVKKEADGTKPAVSTDGKDSTSAPVVNERSPKAEKLVSLEDASKTSS